MNHKYLWQPQPGADHTVVALHGTGGDETDLLPLVQTLYPKANYLGIRGNVSENGAARFFRRFGEGNFDEADIRTRTEDLVTFWESAKTEYDLTPENTTWLGYSNGANMIAALLLTTDIVRNAVLLRAQAPFKQKVKAHVQPIIAKVKILSGEYDTLIPATESRRLKDDLETLGHTVEHILIPTGHQLSRMDLAALTDVATTSNSG